MYSDFLHSQSQGYKLVGRYNKSCDSVEILDTDNIDLGWVDYDPKHGASDNVLTWLCDSLYDRLLLQELGL